MAAIVVSPDRESLVVAQGNVGALWSFNLSDGTATRIDTGDIDLTNADGLVLRGRRLVVVRNFSRVITTVRLDRHAENAWLIREVATDPNRVFTTAKIARGRLLVVDSKFDEQIAQPPLRGRLAPVERPSTTVVNLTSPWQLSPLPAFKKDAGSGGCHRNFNCDGDARHVLFQRRFE